MPRRAACGAFIPPAFSKARAVMLARIALDGKR
jgi:hypothetical protein